MSDIPIRDWLDEKISKERDLRTLQVEAAKEALYQAKLVMEQRLEGMNELRDQINRERGHYVSREVYDQAEERIRSLENSRSNLEGRVWMIGGVFVLLQVVVAVLSFVLKR